MSSIVKRLLIYIIFLTLPATLALFYHPSIIKAETILFQDNFDSGSTDKWITMGDNGWNVQNGKYGIYLNPGLSNSFPSDSYWNFDWTHIVYYVDLTGSSGIDKNIILKFHDGANFIEMHANDKGIYLEKNALQGGGTLGYAHVLLENGVTYHFKSEIDNDKIKIYLDNNLIFDVVESVPVITNWKIGLREGTGAVSPTEVWYDNVLVTDLSEPTPTPTPTPTPVPLPNISVPDIKQYSSPWNIQTYDTATLWSTNPTIERWGCALTSADMILQKYGFTINPGGLNTWLKSQSDGYISNGLLNWIAVSRYSKLNLNSQTTALEYKRLNGTSDNLISELTAGRPAILDEPGHFVVAKSQMLTSFGINDPGFSNRPTLASYNNSFSNIRSYTPSHTDLSYIMLTINPNFDLKITDTNGNEILGDTYIEEPLVDDINNLSTSGSSIKIFEFAKPLSGKYKVEVRGNGIYELDSYLYDQNGNPTVNKTKGIVDSNQVDKFQIIIGQVNSISQNLTINSIADDWNGTQNNITAMFTNAKKLIANNDTKPAKVLLGNAIKFIKSYTPQSIDGQTSQILQSETQNLINSL